MNTDEVLVVGPSWVGDMVMAQALFKQLRTENPAAAIDVVAPAWCLPLLERMPEVRSGFDIGINHGEFGFSKRRQLGRKLRELAYHRAIVLPRSWKSALVPYFAGIPIRTGYRGESRYILVNDMRPFDPEKLDQTVKRFVNLGMAPGSEITTIPEPQLRTDSDRAKALLTAAGVDVRRRTVALAPGAEYGPAKRWPESHFAEVADALARAGYNVIVLGSMKERELGASITAAANSDRVVNFCGSTSLGDAIDLLGSTAAAVCNDSGLLHVAAAAGAHVIAIYGSSSPDFTPPLTMRQTVLYQRIECSPCFNRECPLTHYNCLRTIPADAVTAAITAAVADSEQCM